MKRTFFERGWDIAAMFVALIAILWFLSGCCRQIAPLASTDTVQQTIIREVVRDSTIYLTDSAGFRAALECDSLGRIRIKQIEDFYAGQFVKPKIIIKDNYVKLDCKIDSGRVYLSWKEKHTSESLKTSQTVIQRVNYLTGWQWFQLWTGRILLIALLIFAGVKAVKLYLKLKP